MRGDKTGVFSNAGLLLALQAASYIFPLLVIPYLTRVLGVSLYGVVAFALAVSQFFCIVTDFGFNLSATRRIAESRGDYQSIRKITYAVFASKVFLFLLVGCLLAVFILCQKEKYSEHAALFWLLMLPILGQTFQPIWFFQGIERMGFITVFVVVARSLYVFLVFFLVSSPEDLNWVVISNGISQIVAAVIALFFLLRLGITPLWPGRSFIKSVFFESVQFFWSRIAASTYTLGGVFYLGLFSTPNAVAFYSAADQLYRGAQSLIHPLSQALYPYMARTHDLDFFKKTIKTLVLICIIGLVLGVLVSDWLIVSIFGIQFGDSTPVLRVFMFTLFATSISIMLGYPLLGAFGMSAQANKSVIYAGILQAFLLVVLWSVNARDELYVAITVLVVEVFVFIYRASFARRVLQA